MKILGFVALEPGNRVLLYDPKLLDRFLNGSGPPPICILLGQLRGYSPCR
jgi:hypothetical protein